MSEMKQHLRSSKSSNDGSFEALNQIQEQHRSRPSQSNDFESIRQIVQQKIQETQEDKVEEIKNKTNFASQIILRKQIQRLNLQIKQKNLVIFNLNQQLTQQKKKTLNLQQIIKIQQKQQVYMLENLNKNCSKQIAIYKEKINQLELQIESLNLKLQYFEQEDKKTRQWMQSYLKINHLSQKMVMNLSTLVQSAIIQFETNLKQLSREIEQIIIEFKLKGYEKMNKIKQKYNHWQVLNQLDVIKKVLKQKMLIK